MRNRITVFARALGMFVLAATVASPAAAQASRTWVSGVGDDVNPCSRTAPCKTFAGAISKTATNGEIDALDPGGFGTVTITKSITIDGGAGLAGILGSLTNGVIVNAGTGDVTLRNLSIDGFNNGINGMRLLAARQVTVDHCSIFGFSTHGIDIAPTTSMNVLVVDSLIERNAGSGIRVANGGAFFARLSLTRVSLNRNGTGLTAADNSLVFAVDSHVSNSTNNGWLALPTVGGPAQLDLDHCTSSNNGAAGAAAQNATAVVRFNNSVMDHNAGAGIVSVAGGQLLTFNNNRSIANGGGDGAATGTAVTVF